MTPCTQRAGAVIGALLVGLTLAACSGDDGGNGSLANPSSTATASPSPRPVTSATPTGGPGSASPTARRFPPASTNVEHGGVYWVVYLAVSRLDTSGKPERPGELTRAQQRAEAVGYKGDVGSSDIGCDRGAKEALRLDPARDYVAVAIFFDAQAQAKAFVDAFEPPVVGTARIKAYCLD